MNNSLKQLDGLLAFKWIILGITIYLILGNILNIIGAAVEILTAYLTHNIQTIKLIKIGYSIVATLATIAIFIFSGNYFLKRFKSDFPQGLLITSLIILPFAFILSYGSTFFTSYLYGSRFGVDFIGQLAVFNSIFMIITASKNILILMIPGLMYGLKSH